MRRLQENPQGQRRRRWHACDPRERGHAGRESIWLTHGNQVARRTPTLRQSLSRRRIADGLCPRVGGTQQARTQQARDNGLMGEAAKPDGPPKRPIAAIVGCDSTLCGVISTTLTMDR